MRNSSKLDTPGNVRSRSLTLLNREVFSSQKSYIILDNVASLASSIRSRSGVDMLVGSENSMAGITKVIYHFLIFPLDIHIGSHKFAFKILQ
jgi:hypothetical protein